jgi:hypothetical protein
MRDRVTKAPAILARRPQHTAADMAALPSPWRGFVPDWIQTRLVVVHTLSRGLNQEVGYAVGRRANG